MATAQRMRARRKLVGPIDRTKAGFPAPTTVMVLVQRRFNTQRHWQSDFHDLRMDPRRWRRSNRVGIEVHTFAPGAVVAGWSLLCEASSPSKGEVLGDGAGCALKIVCVGCVGAAGTWPHDLGTLARLPCDSRCHRILIETTPRCVRTECAYCDSTIPLGIDAAPCFSSLCSLTFYSAMGGFMWRPIPMTKMTNITKESAKNTMATMNSTLQS